MYVERIVRDVLTFDSIRPFLNSFFKEVLLPLLLKGPSSGKENQAPNTTNCDTICSASTRHYCWCHQDSLGEWLHVTILTVIGNGFTLNVLD